MLQANRLHREAALLSNSLHTYPDEETEAVKPVVDQILAKREEWKEVRRQIDYIDEFGKLPEPKPEKPTTAATDLTEGEIKAELQLTMVKISQNKKKLRDRPDHAKAPEWESEIARLEAIKREYNEQLIRLKYA
ncbi:hypothetical protein [Tellurirhabdus rosea]|uniref:hypothetical protein n=1 Tax=Tellurirhabdus rosea TaxID=2674997 RepID=UPI002251C978|nr:hypothetical protein [Tellurirhabdus rosea]